MSVTEGGVAPSSQPCRPHGCAWLTLRGNAVPRGEDRCGRERGGMRLHRHWPIVAAAALLLTLPGRALGADRFCDPAYEDCQAPLIALIDNEQVGIDVAFLSGLFDVERASWAELLRDVRLAAAPHDLMTFVSGGR